MAQRAVTFGIATGAYVDERDRWAAAVERAAGERWPYIELTAIFEWQLEPLRSFLTTTDALDGFERVSIHAPAVIETSPGHVVAQLVELPTDADLVFHPDVYREEAGLPELGSRVVFENMDVGKTFGRWAADLAETFARHPDAGFCLDVAHVWTNDPTMRLGDDLLAGFGDRLRQLHVSGIEPDGRHRPTTEADLQLYEGVLARCDHVPWLLEAELVRR